MKTLDVARITLELTSPLSLGDGQDDIFVDNLVLLDANGLPTISGSSLAGVLRSLYGERNSAEATDGLFGFQRFGKGGTHDGKGQRSRVDVSWAAIHGHDDRPIKPLLTPGEVSKDPVLASSRALVLRDHVRLNDQGVVDGRGKFDRSSVMVGHHFTFEVQLADDRGDEFRQLLELIDSPAFRLGAKTRIGLGQTRVVTCLTRRFDLGSRADVQALGALPVDPSKGLPDGFEVFEPRRRSAAGGSLSVELTLTPEEPYIVAGPVEDYAEHHAEDDPPDAVPKMERRVVWEGNGRVGAYEYVIAGSGIKGALRHRTEYHYRVQQREWTSTDEGGSPCRAVEILFGKISESEDAGARGLVIVDDIRLAAGSCKLWKSTHVSIDRFTGAPMQGMLFDDVALWGGQLPVKIQVAKPPADVDGFAEALSALRLAIEDLATGRLGLGAFSNRGYGYFHGEPKFQGAWPSQEGRA